jgi:hypothetical protein
MTRFFCWAAAEVVGCESNGDGKSSVWQRCFRYCSVGSYSVLFSLHALRRRRAEDTRLRSSCL